MQICDITNDFAQATGFLVTFSKIPGVVYHCRTVSIPGLMGAGVEVPTPFHAYPQPGDHMRYEQLSMQYVVNADFSNWKQLVDWMKGIYFPNTYDQHAQLVASDEGVKCDCIVTLLGPSSNPILRISYEGSFPISVSGFQMDTAEEANTPIMASAVFEYQDFKIQKL